MLSPKGMDVRPMMELVRGAAFDILQVFYLHSSTNFLLISKRVPSLIDNIKVAGGCPASLRPGRWLDLYSGTGSVGIEALSRGCTEVTMT